MIFINLLDYIQIPFSVQIILRNCFVRSQYIKIKSTFNYCVYLLRLWIECLLDIYNNLTLNKSEYTFYALKRTTFV